MRNWALVTIAVITVATALATRSGPLTWGIDNVVSIATLRASLSRDPTQIAEAEAWTERAIRWGGSTPARQLRGAQVALARGEPRRAVKALEPEAIPGIGSAILFYWLGVAYDANGEADEATRVWAAVGAMRPVLARAEVLHSQRKYQEALAEYSRILRVMPDLLPALVGRGQLYEETARWPEAYADLATAVKLSPDSVSALVSLGAVDFELHHDLATAVAPITRAIEVSPYCTWCYLKLSGVYASAGKPDQAYEACQSAQKRSPTVNILCETP